MPTGRNFTEFTMTGAGIRTIKVPADYASPGVLEIVVTGTNLGVVSVVAAYSQNAPSANEWYTVSGLEALDPGYAYQISSHAPWIGVKATGASASMTVIAGPSLGAAQ